jgi:hypothetical protein
MDLNPSMEKYANSLKNQIADIIRDLQNDHQTLLVEIAFIGYTGINDWPTDRYIGLTDDIDLVGKMLKKCPVSDGNPDDECRNVVIGYAMADDLDWTSKRRIIFHMGNAPSYGRKYHSDNTRDMFLTSHPYWGLEDKIETIASKNIDIVILKISKTTTIMEKLLENSYHIQRNQGFYIENLTKKLNFLDDAVYKTVKYHIVRMLLK